jgi:hypothetical protein
VYKERAVDGGEDKNEGRVGFEATIAPNTTSSLAAEGETWIGHRKGGAIFTEGLYIARL